MVVGSGWGPDNHFFDVDGVFGFEDLDAVFESLTYYLRQAQLPLIIKRLQLPLLPFLLLRTHFVRTVGGVVLTVLLPILVQLLRTLDLEVLALDVHGGHVVLTAGREAIAGADGLTGYYGWLFLLFGQSFLFLVAIQHDWKIVKLLIHFLLQCL